MEMGHDSQSIVNQTKTNKRSSNNVLDYWIFTEANNVLRPRLVLLDQNLTHWLRDFVTIVHDSASNSTSMLLIAFLPIDWLFQFK